MGVKGPVFSMNGGEVTPLLHGRSDLNKYRSWCKQLDNFTVEPQGAIKRRLGTVIESRIADLDDFTDSVIIPWRIDRDNFFMMVFIKSEIRFFNPNGVRVFTLPIPYSEIDFDELYFRQLIDTMYITHPDYHPKLLIRTEQFVWVIEDVVLDGGPYADDNLDVNSTVTVSKGVNPSVEIVASDPIFSADDVGRTFRVVHPDGISDADSDNTNVTSDALPCGGTTIQLETGGTWAGEVELQISLDNQVTWTTIGVIASENNANNIITRPIDEFNAFCRMKFTRTAGTLDWALSVEGIIYNNYEITAFTDANTVTADIISGFFENLSNVWEWTLGAFSETTGYPTCSEIFEERLFFGGVASYPSTIYASQTNIFTNFQSGTLATSPFSFTLANDIRNRLRWFAIDQQLLVGTDSAEFTIGSRNSSESISISNAVAQKQSQTGSASVQPVQGDNTNYFIEAGNRRVLSSSYVFDADRYIEDDMSILGSHLTKDAKIIKIAYTRTPDRVLYVLLDSGLLLTFTIEPEQNVAAWSKNPMFKNNNDGDDTKSNEEWSLEEIATVVDISSVLTSEGDIVTMIVKRQDGVYYETLSQGNNCIDAQTVFEGISQNDVLALPGNEDFTFWDEAFIEKDVPFQGLGSILRLNIDTITDLVIKYDGVIQIEGDDYSIIRTDLAFWLPLAIDNSLITVFDGVVEVPANDYYTVLATECLVVQVKPLQPISEFFILNDGVLLEEDLEYFAMQGDLQFLIIDPANADPDLITVDVILVTEAPLENQDNNEVLSPGNDEILIDTSSVVSSLPIDQFEVFIPRILISTFGDSTSTAFFGLKIYSTAKLVDEYNFAESDGGLGGIRRDSEVDVYVVDSVNFDFSANANETDNEDTIVARWTAAKFIKQQPIMNEMIPAFTGRIRVDINNGFTTEANIGIRSDSPYCLTVSQIATYGDKYSSKGSR